MDFSFNEVQEQIRDLTRQIAGDLCTPERLKQIEQSQDGLDGELWSRLARADLLGLSIPQAFGGAALGLMETCIVLEELALKAAAVPAWACLVLGAHPIARFATLAQQAELLGSVRQGDLIVTAGLNEPGSDPALGLPLPRTTARRDGSRWRLDGEKTCVPAGMVADRILVPARLDPSSDIGVFIVDSNGSGVSRTPLRATGGVLEAALELDGAVVGCESVLGGSAEMGTTILRWLIPRATASLCVEMAGLCEAALKLTSEYVKSREQFGRAIATFQAVSQRAADAYVDTEAVRLTAWQAVWRLDSDLTSFESVAIAKWWASEAGARVVHAAQHLHGGIGVDRDYPLHRYFFAAKRIELTLGSATPQLLQLGKLMAEGPTEGRYFG
ncbi:MAG: acyl-CoA/acyl-ACP dehydrogenase [Actinobacteria bacterium]|nr:acyl-CoA/acyl-ACP dehydrogenase [Actinomycetota bacterium]